MIRPKREYVDYLRDIFGAIDKAQQFTEGMSFSTFESDDKTVFAVIRALEIIGEATKKLPASLKEHYPGIPWREIASMRDKVIHDYFGVNLRRVFETIRRDLPPLRENIARILSDELYKSGYQGEGEVDT